MLVLGIILLLVAVVVVFGVLLGGGGQPTVDLGAFHVTTTTAGVFLTGAAAVVILVLALWLMASGLRRANQRRQDRKELNRLTRKLEAHEATQAAGAGESEAPSTTAGPAPETTPAETPPTTGAQPDTGTTTPGEAAERGEPGTRSSLTDPQRREPSSKDRPNP